MSRLLAWDLGTQEQARRCAPIAPDTLKNHSPIPFSSRHPLTIEVFEQRNRVLPRNACQLLEGWHVYGLLFRSMRPQLCFQILQRVAMKEHLAVNAHQAACVNQHLKNFASVLLRNALMPARVNASVMLGAAKAASR